MVGSAAPAGAGAATAVAPKPASAPKPAASRPPATAAAPATASSATEQTLTFGRFGTISLYHRTPHPPHVVLFVSGDGGWNQGVVDMARELAAMDALVVGVNITHYLRELEAASDKCSYPASDFEALSQFVQKELDYPRYVTPVLVGYSSGATLVYAILVQAPATTFRGAISLGFCPDLPLVKPFCPGSGLTWGPGPRGKGYSFNPAKHLETPWIALQGLIDQVCDPGQTEAFVGKTPGAEIVKLPKVGHGYAVPRNWLPQFKASFLKVLAAPTADPTRVAPETAAEGAPPAPGQAEAPASAPEPAEQPVPGAPAAEPSADADFAELPLIEVPATGPPRDAIAVHLTGDGGWGVTDKGLSRELAAAGVPVVGWNSLQYYWKRRSPDEAADDLTRILRHYLTAWNKQQAVLIGYSFGADVLPFLVNRLPPDLHERVPLIVLLGPSERASFEFHIGSWLGRDDKTARPVAPEIEKISGVKIYCFHGEGDKDAICASLDPARVTSVVTGGGHRIGGNYEGIAQEIIKALP